jgi:hypothetical protein
MCTPPRPSATKHEEPRWAYMCPGCGCDPFISRGAGPESQTPELHMAQAQLCSAKTTSADTSQIARRCMHGAQPRGSRLRLRMACIRCPSHSLLTDYQAVRTTYSSAFLICAFFFIYAFFLLYCDTLTFPSRGNNNALTGLRNCALREPSSPLISGCLHTVCAVL